MSLASIQMSAAVQMNTLLHLTPADHKLINLDVADSAEIISEFPEKRKYSSKVISVQNMVKKRMIMKRTRRQNELS